jgi:hypothetical protein
MTARTPAAAEREESRRFELRQSFEPPLASIVSPAIAAVLLESLLPMFASANPVSAAELPGLQHKCVRL